jgi:riboflavin synthase
VFTGIVTHRGRVERVDEGGGGARLVVRPDRALAHARVGDSVAVDGVCLTVAAHEDGALVFDVVAETLRRTTLGALTRGSHVHLESALRVGDALGGHLVQGHVEGTGTVAALSRDGESLALDVALDASLFGGTVEKGSITLDGVSLTVGARFPTDRGGGIVRVFLIPHTRAVTGLAAKRIGDRVNVEPDAIGRWVEHHLRRPGPRLLGESAPGSPAGGGG